MRKMGMRWVARKAESACLLMAFRVYYDIVEARRPIFLVNHLEPAGLEYFLGDSSLILTLLNNVGGMVVSLRWILAPSILFQSVTTFVLGLLRFESYCILFSMFTCANNACKDWFRATIYNIASCNQRSYEIWILPMRFGLIVPFKSHILFHNLEKWFASFR